MSYPYKVIERLEVENRRLKRDKARLEWLLKNSTISHCPERFSINWIKTRRHIDAAMRRGKK